MAEIKQRELPFEPAKEQARLQRVERLLRGKLGHKLRRASEMRFDYQRASRIASRGTNG